MKEPELFRFSSLQMFLCFVENCFVSYAQ